MKRIIKILSVMTMCLMLVLGIVACDKPHTHTFDESVWDSNETQHWHPATCEHTSEKKDAADHEDGNDDGKCDVCNADMPETDTPDNPDNPTPHTHTFDETVWASDETQHWHPSNCGHPEQKKDVADHEDGNDDGKCDVCDADMPETDNPTPHTHTFDETVWESDETQHWHPANCGHPEQKKDVADHKDNDNNGKCDVCGADVPHTHSFDEDVWESDETQHWHPSNCGHPEQKKDVSNHEDNDNNGKCDVCGKKDVTFYTNTIDKIIDKVATGKNFTVTLNAKINGKDNALVFKFAENGFDFPTFKSKELRNEDGDLIGIVRTSISMRNNSIYALDSTYDVVEGVEAATPSTKILNKIALPEEIEDLSSLLTIIKNYIKVQLADVDLSFFDFEETDNGYELYCDTDITPIVNFVIGILYQMKDTPLNDIIASITELVASSPIDIATMIKEEFIPALDGKTVADLVKLLDELLPKVAQKNLSELIDSLATSLGIKFAPQSIYGILGKLNLEVPAPEEGETLGAYVAKILQTGKIGNVKLDDIVKKIADDDTVTVKSLLTKLANFLENATLSKLLPFIPFETLNGMNFTQFKLYLKLDVDKEYAIQSLTAGIDSAYISENIEGNKTLEFSCGFEISQRGNTSLSTIEESLLENNLKFADDNVLDETIITSVVKALVKKYTSGIISIDQLKAYYTKLVTLIKSSSLNEKVFTDLGFEKGEPDENGNYVLSERLVDLLPIITPLVESLSPAMKEGLDLFGDDLGITVTDPLTEVPLMLALISLIDIDLEGDQRTLFVGSLLEMLAGLENLFIDSSEEKVPTLKSVMETLPDLGAMDLIDKALDFLGVSMDDVYNFCKQYDADIAAPLTDEKISEYLARCLNDKGEDFSEELGNLSINAFLSAVTGSDFYTWFHENVQPLLNLMLVSRFSDIQTLDIQLLITVDENHVIRSVELAICYSAHAEPLNEGEEAQDLAGKFTLLKFTANA